MPIKYVYVSGPLSSSGYFIDNIRTALQAADRLLERGYAPYVPHLNCLWEVMTPYTYETWLQLDLDWILRCDALIRLPGHSPGGDREVVHALAHGIPVYFGLGVFLGH